MKLRSFLEEKPRVRLLAQLECRRETCQGPQAKPPLTSPCMGAGPEIPGPFCHS